jgi:NAD(P)H-dependent FMN reductase
MTTIGIVLGSTRPSRVGAQVAAWVHQHAAARGDAEFDLVDLVDHPLPHLDEAHSPMLGQYEQEHTRAWARTMGSYDGYVFVTAEYNHGVPGVLKNAIDYLYPEWQDKAVGLVSYGIWGGTGAAAQLRQICGQLGMADVSRQVALTLGNDFQDYREFRPTPHQSEALTQMLDQVLRWTEALTALRGTAGAA